jgi:pyridoxal 5-phosphate dependent beta-lyase
LDTDQLQAARDSVDGLAEPWRDWARRRPPPAVIHLDSAAAGRSSVAVLQATAAYAVEEARWGAYVAAEHAAPALAELRAQIGQLIGMPADGVAWTESAQTALARLLTAWPFEQDASVGVLGSEWGPNLEAFANRGLALAALPTDGVGQLDLGAFEQLLKVSPPTIVHLPQVAAHRGLVQPIASAAALCREQGVPLWVDASQALGHVQTDCGADVVYATSRKWLAGPRGVGLLGVAERHWPALRLSRPAMLGPDLPRMRVLESGEANVAGRVGLATAVQEYVELGPAQVWRRLVEVGRSAREALAATPGWLVIDPPDAECAVVALEPTAGQDVVATRHRLLHQHGILTTASLPVRAPRELDAPLLRLSPHVDCTATMLAHLATALGGA